eukprot:CAMPEP_0171795500 /NCGR_PEP_ID=MMETSP0991-20121206/68758_1 /TAXON_ID=483369 /ORGANISM="non described non described, Strain CCMP2098" /LENGTH=75 /DNA_ID=CAMNT_0012406105 /DNA_START=98 /DNA_END=322 /DNA_ORIENTATION=-
MRVGATLENIAWSARGCGESVRMGSPNEATVVAVHDAAVDVLLFDVILVLNGDDGDGDRGDDGDGDDGKPFSGGG